MARCASGLVASRNIRTRSADFATAITCMPNSIPSNFIFSGTIPSTFVGFGYNSAKFRVQIRQISLVSGTISSIFRLRGAQEHQDQVRRLRHGNYLHAKASHQFPCLQVVHRVSSSLLDLVDLSFRARSARLKCTVRRHKINKIFSAPYLHAKGSQFPCCGYNFITFRWSPGFVVQIR